MSSCEEILQRLKSASGFSQRELARRAHMSNASLVAYAKGRQDPGLTTLERLAEAADCDLVVEVRPRLSQSERRTLAFHRAVAEKIEKNPSAVIEIAKRCLDGLRNRDVDGHSAPYFDAWQFLLDGPVADLLRVMTSTDAVARDLRQASPFSGILTDDERLDVLMAVDGADVASKSNREIAEVRALLVKSGQRFE